MSYYRYTNYSRPSLFGGFRYFPPVIKTLLLSNVGVFLLSGALSVFKYEGIPLEYYFMTLFPLFPLGGGFQPWQLLTYLFLHGSIMHLFFNMLALWMFGMELENEWGAKKFLTYYLLCGVGAGISNLLLGPIFGQAGPTVGASGAVYGILVAFAVMYPDRPIFLYFLLPIKARTFVILYILLELYAGTTGTTDGIAHFAHLGGAAVGFLYLAIERRRMPLGGFFARARREFMNPLTRTGDAHPAGRGGESEPTDATFTDIGEDEHKATQKKIDEILDKISQHGYQSLSEEEKRLLFDASKKLN